MISTAIIANMFAGKLDQRLAELFTTGHIASHQAPPEQPPPRGPPLNTRFQRFAAKLAFFPAERLSPLHGNYQSQARILHATIAEHRLAAHSFGWERMSYRVSFPPKTRQAT